MALWSILGYVRGIHVLLLLVCSCSLLSPLSCPAGDLEFGGVLVAHLPGIWDAKSIKP